MPAIVSPYNLGSTAPPTALVVESVDRKTVNTGMAIQRFEERKKRAAALNKTDIRDMEFIPFRRIRETLLGLNKNIWFEDMPDSLLAICLRQPSVHAISTWEAQGLVWSDQQKVKALQGTDIGPSIKMVAISTGLIAPFKDLVSWGKVPTLISRSLKGIIRRCVTHGAFTWEEAELAFGIRFRGRGVTPVFMNTTVDMWGRRPEQALLDVQRTTPESRAYEALTPISLAKEPKRIPKGKVICTS